MKQKVINLLNIKQEQKILTFPKIAQKSAPKMIESDQIPIHDKISSKEIKKIFNYVETEQINPLVDELSAALFNGDKQINLKNDNWSKLDKILFNFIMNI